MRRKLVAGNWKMNGNLAMLEPFVKAVMPVDFAGVEIVICPPSLYLDRLVVSASEQFCVGAQNVHFEHSGAFTGELSAAMLADIGCEYVIVGHSERRQLFAETDQQIAKKVKAVVDQDMTAILCVGETLSQRQAQQWQSTVVEQVKQGLSLLSDHQLSRVVIAYEPVWAIGTGKTAQPEQAQEVHACIRASVAVDRGQAHAESLAIVYGGSVNPTNAAELFAQSDVDGALVGGASLTAHDFLAICSLAAASVKV